MNPYDIINPAQLSIIDDDELIDIIGDTPKAVKGPRKPDGWDECFTLHIPSNPRDPDTKIHNGTLNINYYCPNHPDGNVDMDKHGQVVERLIELFDDNWPKIEGYKISDWSVREPLGPIPVQDNPKGESYTSLRIGFVVRKINSEVI